ncbi:MAG: stage V sporulation protein B [Bacillota bacterium]|nr:stage V sporulation protein B [Bacillota bacterium]
MKLDSFYKNTLILTLSNLTTGILKFVFSIILSKDLGAEGLGLYSIVMPIYDLFCFLVCGGLVIAISRKTAILTSNNDYLNINKLLKVALFSDMLWSIFVALLVFFNASFISTYIIKDARTIYSIQAICPALIFVALSAVLKGYFYGVEKAKIPSYIDIFEKAVRITVVIAIIDLFMLKEVTTTVTAVYIALTMGEFISFIMLYVAYRYFRSKHRINNSIKSEGSGQILFDMLTVALPLCLNGFLGSILTTISTLIIPRRLVSAGIDYSEALSMIGKFSGMALNITFFPIIIIASMATVLVPELSKNLSQKNYYALEDRITEVIRISFLLGLATMVICLALPNSLGQLFFGRADLAPYIVIAAISCPISYAAAVTFGILSGLGKQKEILINSMLISIEELILLYILTGMKSINIYGYGIALLIANATSYFINLKDIKKTCYIRFPFIDIVIYTLFSVLFYLILKIINNVVPNDLFMIKNAAIIALGFTLFFFSEVALKDKLSS